MPKQAKIIYQQNIHSKSNYAILTVIDNTGVNMKIPKEKYESSILRGSDLKDSELATIVDTGTYVFNQGEEKEREAITVSVDVDCDYVTGTKLFALSMTQLKYMVEKMGDDTDAWKNKKVRLTPTQSTTPTGKATTVISITVPQKK